MVFRAHGHQYQSLKYKEYFVCANFRSISTLSWLIHEKKRIDIKQLKTLLYQNICYCNILNAPFDHILTDQQVFFKHYFSMIKFYLFL